MKDSMTLKDKEPLMYEMEKKAAAITTLIVLGIVAVISIMFASKTIAVIIAVVVSSILILLPVVGFIWGLYLAVLDKVRLRENDQEESL